MRSIRARWLGVMMLACPAACSGPSEPSPVPPGYAGEWAGITGQGTPVNFTVSGEEVTALTLTFNFSSTCSGSLTSPERALIHMQVPPGPPPFDQPGFAMGWPQAPSDWGVAVAGHFSPDRRSAAGEFKLVQYPACDVVMSGTWSARRR